MPACLQQCCKHAMHRHWNATALTELPNCISLFFRVVLSHFVPNFAASPQRCAGLWRHLFSKTVLQGHSHTTNSHQTAMNLPALHPLLPGSHACWTPATLDCPNAGWEPLHGAIEAAGAQGRTKTACRARLPLDGWLSVPGLPSQALPLEASMLNPVVLCRPSQALEGAGRLWLASQPVGPLHNRGCAGPRRATQRALARCVLTTCRGACARAGALLKLPAPTLAPLGRARLTSRPAHQHCLPLRPRSDQSGALCTSDPPPSTPLPSTAIHPAAAGLLAFHARHLGGAPGGASECHVHVAHPAG